MAKKHKESDTISKRSAKGIFYDSSQPPRVLILERGKRNDDIPGGQSKGGETPEQTIRREAAEEISNIILGQVTPLTTIQLAAGKEAVREVCFFTVAVAEPTDGFDIESKEHTGYRWEILEDAAGLDSLPKHHRVALALAVKVIPTLIP